MFDLQSASNLQFFFVVGMKPLQVTIASNTKCRSHQIIHKILRWLLLQLQRLFQLLLILKLQPHLHQIFHQYLTLHQNKKNFRFQQKILLNFLKSVSPDQKKNIRRGKTAIITESPYENTLNKQENIKNIKKKKENKRKPITKRKLFDNMKNSQNRSTKLGAKKHKKRCTLSKTDGD